jgi:8-oxo-dGTP diphosphatase
LYEAILNEPLDKRNFRKKILKLDIIKETKEYQKNVAHRPAKLYQLKRNRKKDAKEAIS